MFNQIPWSYTWIKGRFYTDLLVFWRANVAVQKTYGKSTKRKSPVKKSRARRSKSKRSRKPCKSGQVRNRKTGRCSSKSRR